MKALQLRHWCCLCCAEPSRSLLWLPSFVDPQEIWSELDFGRFLGVELQEGWREKPLRGQRLGLLTERYQSWLGRKLSIRLPFVDSHTVRYVRWELGWEDRDENLSEQDWLYDVGVWIPSSVIKPVLLRQGMMNREQATTTAGTDFNLEI